MVTSNAPSDSPNAASPGSSGGSSNGPRQLAGTPAVSGLAHGPLLIARTEISDAAIAAFDGSAFPDPDSALARFDEVAGLVADGFSAKASYASGPAAEVLTASAGLARDNGLRAAVLKHLTGGDDLLAAVRAAVESFVTIFTNLGGLMAERVTDLRDIERRVIARLVGESEPGVPTPEQPSVLVAADLAPADTAGLDPALILALVTERGGPTSHTAIIARQLGLPCVVGAAGALDLDPGSRVLVDGTTGLIEVDPDAADADRRVAEDRAARAALESWAGPGQTADGVGVRILANVADGASAASAAQVPIEGVGLFRTELSFLDRKEEPTVAEQTEVYSAVLNALAGKGPGEKDRYVVIRTLDAGSDKPLAFANLVDEENPALGVRGLRLSFENPGLLEHQLDGIAAAAQASGTETWVMAPMVATVEEASDFAAEVRKRGLKAGVMVEVPSAALLAHRMLEVVDFLSIGTNDLTQYTMAADRQATDLAKLTDAWQPAVLHLISLTAMAGHQAEKSVGVCGEAAADPLLACALVGMGITSLSMAAAAVRPVGAKLGSVTMAQCQQAAEAALAAADPMAARAAVRDALAG